MQTNCKLNNLRDRGYEWFKERSHGAHAKFWLATLSFSESSFFPIPPDVLLIAILLTNAKRWIYYALFTALFSVLGAIVGYFIGYFFFGILGEKIINFYNLKNEFISVSQMFSNNSFWVMFTAAFTPIPYKIFVLTGGFFKVNFLMFLVGSIVGRSARFLFVSYVIKRFRMGIAKTIFNYFNIITYSAVFLIALFVLYRFM